MQQRRSEYKKGEQNHTQKEDEMITTEIIRQKIRERKKAERTYKKKPSTKLSIYQARDQTTGNEVKTNEPKMMADKLAIQFSRASIYKDDFKKKKEQKKEKPL
jgi:hypothetical protein